MKEFIRVNCPEVLSLSEFDLGRYTGPPVSIETNPGASVNMPEKPMAPSKNALGDVFIQQMLETGILKRVLPSAWSLHCLFIQTMVSP